jgi:hypothetical protein
MRRSLLNENPAGRLDVAAARAMRLACDRLGLVAVYDRLAPEFEEYLRDNFGGRLW